MSLKKDKKRGKSGGKRKSPKSYAGSGERARLVAKGAGGFLNPPDHPEHKFSMETDLRRKPENRGFMSLSSAAEAEYLSFEAREAARDKLKQWKKSKKSLTHPDTQDWIRQVMGYTRDMYSPDGKNWKVADLESDHDRNPIEHQNRHAGVHHIKKFYPNYRPKPEHFDEAYWGAKVKRVWKKQGELQDRKLKKSDVIRFKRKKDGVYVYGVAQSGFGMDMDTVGSAIYVSYESYNPLYSINRRNNPVRGEAKWSRDWEIEVLVK